MGEKQSGSSARARRAAANGKHMPDRDVDFSDVPDSTDEELRRARRVGRPRTAQAKTLIAIRLAPALLARLRALARKQKKPYQTLVHEILDRATKRVA